MRRRGQVALEFIMTYGWAILVVLVAIGALAYFGVLNPSNLLPERCFTSAGIACTDHIFRVDGSSNLQLQMYLRNGLGEGLTIGQGNITALSKTTLVGCSPDPGGWVGGRVTIPADTSQGFLCVFTGQPASVGDNAKAQITFNYTVSSGIYPKRGTGDATGKVQ